MDDRRCGARRRNGEPCLNWKMRGGKRCGLHGGKSPQALRSARERLEELQPEAIKVVRRNLREGNLKASQVVFKATGIDQPYDVISVAQVAEILTTMIAAYGDLFLQVTEIDDDRERRLAWADGVERAVVRRIRPLFGVDVPDPGPEPLLPAIATPATPSVEQELIL